MDSKFKFSNYTSNFPKTEINSFLERNIGKKDFRLRGEDDDIKLKGINEDADLRLPLTFKGATKIRNVEGNLNAYL